MVHRDTVEIMVQHAKFYSPSAVAVSSSNEVYIADYRNQRIRKIDANWIITTFAGTGTQGYSGDGGLATSAKLSSPVRVSVSPTNRIYICDQSNNRIRKIDTNGTITTARAQLNSPYGLFVSSTNEVYIADRFNKKSTLRNYLP